MVSNFLILKPKVVFFFFDPFGWYFFFVYWFQDKKLAVFWPKFTIRRVSKETFFIFYFYFGSVSRENWMKLAVLVSDFFGIKKETGWWFHYFKGHKIMKPPEVSRDTKWNWRHAASGKKWNWRHAAKKRGFLPKTNLQKL